MLSERMGLVNDGCDRREGLSCHGVSSPHRKKGQPSVVRWKAHFVYDGAVARIRMQKIEKWIALQKHQVRRPLPITLFQIADSLFFTSELRLRIREITG